MHKKHKKNHPARLRARLEQSLERSGADPQITSWFSQDVSYVKTDFSILGDILEQVVGVKLPATGCITLSQALLELSLRGVLRKEQGGSFYGNGFELQWNGDFCSVCVGGVEFTHTEWGRKTSPTHVLSRKKGPWGNYEGYAPWVGFTHDEWEALALQK